MTPDHWTLDEVQTKFMYSDLRIDVFIIKDPNPDKLTGIL